MLANSGLLTLFHPLRHLPTSEKICLTRDGMTEAERPECIAEVDKKPRPLLVALLDPLDFMISFRGSEGVRERRGCGRLGVV